MNELDPLFKANSGNDQEVAFADQYTKGTRAIQVTTVSSADTVSVFVSNSGMSYEIPAYTLSEIALQFVDELSVTFIARISSRILTNTAFNTPTKGQVAHFSRTIVPPLSHYVAKHQTN